MLRPQELIARRYVVQKALGQGGMGAVFLATDRETLEPVALKVLLLAPSESHLRFRREFRLMSRFRHPNILRVYDSGMHDEMPFVVMEYLTGGTLAEAWREAPAGLADLRERLRLLGEVVEALAYIHAQGVIHRDVTPDNVMLELSLDGSARAKLMDFGLAETEESSALSGRGVLLGTVAYLSPEGMRGAELDSRSDLYSFGCLLYWALTGRPPFDGATVADTLGLQRLPPLLPSSRYPAVPPELDRLVLRLLEAAPEKRPSSAMMVVSALRAGRYRLPGAAEDAAEPLPLDFTPADLFRTPLCGHQRVWETLQAALRQGGAFKPEAEAGLGLTRLLSDLRREARAQGLFVLRLDFGRDLSLPYDVLADALRALRRRAPRIFDAAAAGKERALEPLLSGTDGLGTAALHAAVTELLTAFAAVQPLALIADDVQCADSATQVLLEHLLQSPFADASPLVLGYHPTSPPLVSGVQTMKLEPLDEPTMRRFLHTLLGGELEARLEAEILARAAGKPALARELLQLLLKSGELVRRQELWVTQTAVRLPRSLGSILMARSHTVPARARETLEAASTIGFRFTFELLREVTQADEDSLLDDLDSLLRDSLIRELRDGFYCFEHPQLRSILYRRLTVARRRRYHETLAGLLRHDPRVQAARLAEHYAATGVPQRAVPYALEAARSAAKLNANNIARRYYRLALAILPRHHPQRKGVKGELEGLEENTER